MLYPKETAWCPLTRDCCERPEGRNRRNIPTPFHHHFKVHDPAVAAAVSVRSISMLAFESSKN